MDPFVSALLKQLKKLALFEFVDTKPIKDEIKAIFLPMLAGRSEADTETKETQLSAGRVLSGEEISEIEEESGEETLDMTP